MLPVKIRSVAALIARATPLKRMVPVEVAEKTVGVCTCVGTTSLRDTSNAVVSVGALPFAIAIWYWIVSPASACTVPLNAPEVPLRTCFTFVSVGSTIVMLLADT